MGALCTVDAQAGTQSQFARGGLSRSDRFAPLPSSIGLGGRMLPILFRTWQTVYGWFRELARRFLFQTIHNIELMLNHECQGRDPP
jgi:hypothetical protein